ncbi:MAG: helix-turn-helix domain-containing protein [Rhodospirillaceae bacterium]|nr:helix-turn-helix domain-containing protein [Rhodospirillales bacterium]
MSDDTDNPRSAASVIARIAKALELPNDAAVAKALGIPPTTLNSRKSRNSVPYEECVHVSDKTGCSIHWLITGEGDMHITHLAAHNTPFDEGLLSDIIEALEDMCASEGVSLPARKKAEVIPLLYDYFLADKKVERPTVARFLRLVA